MEKRILFLADKFVSHSALTALDVRANDIESQADNGDLARAHLVIVDCRQLAATILSDPAGIVARTIAAGTALLLLSPGIPHLKAAHKFVPAMDLEPSEAVMIASHKHDDGSRHFHLEILGHEIQPAHWETESANSGITEDHPAGGIAHRDHCGCEETHSGRGLSDGAGDFIRAVRKAAFGQAFIPEVKDSPPTGVIYFLVTKNLTYPFTYTAGGRTNKSAGSITNALTIWGFLSQTSTSNTQYLILQDKTVLSPGTLNNNNDEDRGVINGFLKMNMRTNLSPNTFVPGTAKCTDFSGNVSIPISYQSPTGGYQIYDFEDSVSDSVSSWCLASSTDSSSLGAQWYMNSPAKATDLGSTWKDAFTFWGHVEGMPGASTGSLSVQSIAVFNTGTMLSGNQSINFTFNWQGIRFYSTSCFLGQCAEIHYGSTTYTGTQSTSVNFDPINPG